jgi:hypothetical protein
MRKQTKSPAAGGSPCLCQGAGPALSELLQRLAPPEAARGHFETARVEFLKGLRAVLDARIDRHTKARTRGQAIKVE